jgi:hypothetical protein
MSKEFRLSGFRGRADLPSTAEGWRASEAAREWCAENRYQDYLYLHGLSVEMALAEYVHKRIRGELGFAAEEARDPTQCSPKATAAAAIRSATRPAPTSPTSSNCWRCAASPSPSRLPQQLVY